MKDAIDITEQEIKWHEENRGDGPTREWEAAFIAGLKHLLDLFRQQQATSENEEEEKP